MVPLSLSLIRTRSFKALTLAALLGLGWNIVQADEPLSPVRQTAGADGASGELFDTYLVTDGTPCLTPNSNCLPGHAVPGSVMPPSSPTDPGIPVDPTTPDVPPAPPSTATPSTPSPSAVPPFTDNQQPFVDFNQGFNSQTLLASREVPAMIGDFFGGNPAFAGGAFGFGVVPDPSSGPYGRLKLAENVNPVPTDRFFVNYSYFNNTILNGIDVNRVTFGAEKTFLGGAMSLEVRVPTVGSLGDDVVFNGSAPDFDATGTSEWNVGNMQLYLKGIIAEGDMGLITAGLGVGVPTADDTSITSGGQTALGFKNEAWHLLPFIAGVYTPNDNFFATTLLQFDFDLNGQSVIDYQSGTPTQIGVYTDQNYIFISQGIGYWIVNEPGMKLAPIAEIHINQSMTDADLIDDSSAVGGLSDNITIVNGVLGMTAVLNNDWRASAAYVMPLGIGGSDEQFDGEFRFIVNYYFGGSRNVVNQSRFF